MMHDPLTIPADASSPDANRAGPDASARLPQDRAGEAASARLPEWLAHLLALVIRFMLRRMSRRSRPPCWWHDRPDLPAGSIEALAASIRGPFGNAVAWMCLRRGFGPGHPDWPYLARTIVAFGGSVKGFRAGARPYGLQWWEHPEVTPGAIGETVATPAADAMAWLLSRHAADAAASPAATNPALMHIVRSEAGPALPPVFAAAGLGAYRHRSANRAARCLGAPIRLCPHERGQRMAGPAVQFVPSANSRLQRQPWHADQPPQPVAALCVARRRGLARVVVGPNLGSCEIAAGLGRSCIADPLAARRGNCRRNSRSADRAPPPERAQQRCRSAQKRQARWFGRRGQTYRELQYAVTVRTGEHGAAVILSIAEVAWKSVGVADKFCQQVGDADRESLAGASIGNIRAGALRGSLRAYSPVSVLGHALEASLGLRHAPARSAGGRVGFVLHNTGGALANAVQCQLIDVAGAVAVGQSVDADRHDAVPGQGRGRRSAW